MDKIGIFDASSNNPKHSLVLTEEIETIDLDVVSREGEYISSLLTIDKKTLQVSTPKDVNSALGFETNREGEIEIYGAE